MSFMKLPAGVCAVLLAGCAHFPAPDAQPQTIPLAQYVEQLRKVDVTVNGQSRDFLFDTGGGYTVVSPQISEAVDCKPSGMLTGFRMSGERVDFQKCGIIELRIDDRPIRVQAGLFDINSLIPDSLPPLHGVLTLQTFADNILTIDLANNVLVVETDESFRERIRAMQPLDVSFYNEVEGRGMDVYLKADANGKQVYMLLDSGNLGSIALRPEAWHEVSDSEPPAAGEHREVALRFGDAGTRNLAVAVRALIHEGTLNVDFVESGVFTFDFPNRRAWVRWHVQDQ